MLKKHYLLLLTIVLISIFFRSYGIFQGAGAHPDERHIVMTAEKLNWQNLNPKSFAYGSLPFYILRGVAGAASFIYPSAASYDALFKVGRLLMVSITSINVLLVFILAQALNLTPILSCLAALLFALNIFHIQLAHFFTVDPLLTFTSTLFFIFLVRLIQRRTLLDYCLTGTMLGISLAVKVSALNLFLPLILSHIAVAFSVKEERLRKQAYFLTSILLVIFFAITLQPYLIFDFKEFSRQVKEQVDMVKGLWTPPYTLQYVHTKSYLYPLQQMFYFTLTPVVLVISLIGIALSLFSLKKINLERKINFIWVVVVFIVFGRYLVKFPRYFLPIYPLLFIGAAIGIEFLASYSKIIARVCSVGLILTSLFYASALLNIYNYPHSYVEASSWVYDNVPSGSRIIGVHWDDKVPMDLPGHQSHIYRMWDREAELPLYEADNQAKMDLVATRLATADYLIFPTQRLPGSILQVKDRYPESATLLMLLFKEQAGYKIVKTVKHYPEAFGIKINDDALDESLSVYDHPKVVIMKNEGRLAKEAIMDLIEKNKNNLGNFTREEILEIG